MSKTNTKDRRSSERVTLWSPVELAGPEGAAPAALKNLSVAGICCTTSRAFPELSLVKVMLDLPSPAAEARSERTRLELTGAVVRCVPLRHGTGKRRFEVALYFTELTARARQSLADLVRRRLG
jgi:hypothetical protein